MDIFTRKVRYLILVISILAILLCMAVLWFYISLSPELSFTKEELPGFGSFYGGVTGPFLSLFSFLAILFSLAFQSYELRQSTKELSKSAKAHSEQVQLLNEQIKLAELQSRQALTLKIYERWSSRDFMALRHFIYDYLNSIDDQSDWNTIKIDHHEEFSQFVHFFHDLIALLEYKHVDESMVNTLMGETTLVYLELFEEKILYIKESDQNWIAKNFFNLIKYLHKAN